MLIQMPRGSSDSPGTQNAEEGDAFEAALRRDLASAPVISYEATLGGWPKRAIELALTLITAPVWLAVLFGAVLWSKARHQAPALLTQELVGYGGHTFKCYWLRVEQPTAVVSRLHAEDSPANDWTEIARQAEDPAAKWRRALSRLPQLLNVVRGEMALVGPRPLTREALEPLRTAKRYYLSARPGIVGVESIADPADPSSQYKGYALSWTLDTDALILWDALRSLRKHGKLWRPDRPKAKVSQDAQAALARRRSAAPNS